MRLNFFYRIASWNAFWIGTNALLQCVADLGQLNLIWRFDFRLEPIFATPRAASKNITRFKSGRFLVMILLKINSTTVISLIFSFVYLIYITTFSSYIESGQGEGINSSIALMPFSFSLIRNRTHNHPNHGLKAKSLCPYQFTSNKCLDCCIFLNIKAKYVSHFVAFVLQCRGLFWQKPFDKEAINCPRYSNI